VLAIASALQVRSLCWSADDTRLLSSGADGAVYEWRLSDLKRWASGGGACTRIAPDYMWS
jgi:hypothetical protein